MKIRLTWLDGEIDESRIVENLYECFLPAESLAFEELHERPEYGCMQIGKLCAEIVRD